MKIRLNQFQKTFLIILIIGFLIRIFLAWTLRQFTVYSDLNTFIAWGNNIAENGFSNFYSGWSDYLPGYLYILGFFSTIYNFLLSHSIIIPTEVFYKIPSMLTDIGNTIFIYLIAKKFTHQAVAFFTSLIYYLNPVFWANSTLWGQADGFMTFFLLSSFYYLLSGKYWLSALLLGIGQAVKPIAILSLPFYLLYLFFQKKPFKIILVYLVIFTLVVLVLFIPFNNSDNFFEFIIERHILTANQYPHTSLNAFNFWSTFSNFWIPDKTTYLNISYHLWGNILFGIVYLILLITMLLKFRRVHNQPLFLVFILTIVYTAMFMLLTRMHERHLYYGLAYLTVLLPALPTGGFMAVILIYYINLLNLYYPYSQATPIPLSLEKSTIVFLSATNLAILLYLVIIFLRRYVKAKQ